IRKIPYNRDSPSTTNSMLVRDDRVRSAARSGNAAYQICDTMLASYATIRTIVNISAENTSRLKRRRLYSTYSFPGISVFLSTMSDSADKETSGPIRKKMLSRTPNRPNSAGSMSQAATYEVSIPMALAIVLYLRYENIGRKIALCIRTRYLLSTRQNAHLLM